MRVGTAVALALVTAALAGGIPALPAAKERHPLPTYVCRQTSGAITVDGVPNEPAWKEAEVFTDFRLNDGLRKPTDRTEFRALWDGTYLHLSFVCSDPELVATMTKRDSPLYAEDCVECFLSTGGDIRRYFEFELSPKNVQMDASVFPTRGRREKIV